MLGIWDNLKCSVNRDDVSLLVITDYSKVLDNVRYNTALGKIHRLTPLVQIEDKCSDFARVAFDLYLVM